MVMSRAYKPKQSECEAEIRIDFEQLVRPLVFSFDSAECGKKLQEKVWVSFQKPRPKREMLAHCIICVTKNWKNNNDEKKLKKQNETQLNERRDKLACSDIRYTAL